MNHAIKLAVIGGGYWGKNLIRDFDKCSVLDTICDKDKILLKKYNTMYPHIKTTDNWEEVLVDTSITAVCISLPAEMHYKFAKESLLFGKDVFVEKPITLDYDEGRELVEIAKKKDKILMVGHLLHYHPCISKIKSLIDEGRIGKIKNIISNRFNLGKFRISENVLWSFAPHDISVIISLCNNELPDSICCIGKDILNKGIHDITNTVLKYKKRDIYVNINVNWLNPYKEQKLVVIGEKGMILFDDTLKKNKLKLFKDYVRKTSACPIPNKSEGINIKCDSKESPLLRECKHFINCCKLRITPVTDGYEGLRVLKVLEKLQYSLTNGGINVKINQNTNKFFVHETAVVDDIKCLGKGTKVWHYSHVSKGCVIGDNCNIGQNVYIAPGTVLGNNCKVQNNVSVYSGVECEDYVFLGPSCVLTNDINPRAQYSKNGEYMKTYIERGATIGANATIICGNRIGKYSLIGAGAVVTKDVEPYSIVVGNPAKKIGSIDEFGNRKMLDYGKIDKHNENIEKKLILDKL